MATISHYNSSLIPQKEMPHKRIEIKFPMRSLDFFFNLPNPSSRTMALGLTQPLTEMSTRNLPEGQRAAENLIDTFEQIVKKIWKPRRLTILWALTACYKDSFTFLMFETCQKSFYPLIFMRSSGNY
jgi:hypothetical protein